MNKNITTIKHYYIDPWCKSIQAKVLDIAENGIVLDRTIAYPEGGGQEGDHGFLNIDDQMIAFTDTQKGLGRSIFLDDFPVIQVEMPIYHIVDDAQKQLFQIGQEVRVNIDPVRRAKLTLSHSGIHMVLMALEELYPDYEKRIYGASIKEDGARLDFRTAEKFTPEDMRYIEERVNALIEEARSIKVFPHPLESEAWYWQCGEYVIPCGGTHLENTSYLGKVHVRRKNLGKNGQRVIFHYEDADIFQKKFHAC